MRRTVALASFLSCTHVQFINLYWLFHVIILTHYFPQSPVHYPVPMCFPNVGGESDEETGDRPGPRFGSALRGTGSPAHGYDHAPEP
jgi:hypothetical protein